VSEPPIQPVLHEIDFRLSYGDCDPAGIVYFAAYYPWFDRTYNEWAFLGGFAPSKMVELWGATHVSVASDCRYRIPGRLHDPFTCRLRLGHVGTTSISIALSIDHRENGATYADGSMTFVFVTGALDADIPPQPTPVPQGMLDVLAAAGCDLAVARIAR
jgi:acyl-CoA thioester hydrolase